MSRRRRSLMAQIRIGILPLEIETGRYTPIFDKLIKKNRRREPNERICKLCDLNKTEDEFHFLCICPIYTASRIKLITQISLTVKEFPTLSLHDQFIYLMKHRQIEVSKYLDEIWAIRQSTI